METDQVNVQNLTNLGENGGSLLRGIINSMTDENELLNLQGLIASRRVEIERGRQSPTLEELQQRLDALRQRAPPEVNRLNESIEVDPIEVDPQEPTTADMPEGSSDINVDSPSPNLLNVSLEVASPDVDLRTGYQNPSSQPDTWPYGEWVREAEERMNSGLGQQGNSSNPASDPELAALEADMNMNMNSGQGQQGDSSNPVSDPELAELAADMDDMNWRNIVASERPPTRVENDTGNARKKKTKKKRRKSKKKKKPYEDLIMTQKKRLAKLQKMSEKLSKKMSKTKKKRRKKKVSDSY